MARFVQFTEYGGPEGYHVIDVSKPEPGVGEIRVRVLATGLNPVDHKITAYPQIGEAYGLHLPSGNGNDFAGVVDAVGAGVTWSTGDLVYGGKRFYAQADYLITTADKVIAVPDGLSVEQAGALDIVGRTAVASVRAVDPKPGETVLVSAAAGGVGVLAAQLAVDAGARVIGTASESNHEYLRGLRIEPVAYGEGLLERVRALVPEGVDAVLDNQGRATLELAVALGVPKERVNTIADRPFATEHGFSGIGGADATIDDLAELGKRIAAGDLDFPIDSVYPLERVVEAYQHLIAGHLRGKVVLVTE
ncbi:NADP-dependent oxidoreductase [Plantibacter sp. YIM 135347]|uniref:NADP-dependent oxidoreductase n=1 Tax=Plantibacter sp. YIM 135347 TaxID=3423919 RepID=UPI003D342F18